MGRLLLYTYRVGGANVDIQNVDTPSQACPNMVPSVYTYEKQDYGPWLRLKLGFKFCNIYY